MIGLAAWTALVLLPAVVGGVAWPCAVPRAAASCVPPARRMARAELAFFSYLSGFALLSAGFFVLAHVGRLSTGVAAVLVVALVAGCLAVGRWRGSLSEARTILPSAVAVGVAFSVASSLFATVLPPIDATVAGSDSSIYLGVAQHLARTGRLTHQDPLVAAMTVEEREALFRNRFEADRTGPHARFPGGVSLASPAGATVSFYFFHLFPVWLAVGLETVGGALYLRLMSLFACMGLASLFVAGRHIGGTALGILACVCLVSFHPQAFFSRFPSSELLAQALFLSGLASLLCGRDGDFGADGRQAHLAGWLWGAFCLCRVDALPFVALGLAVMSILPARTGVRARDWLVPMATTSVFASVALVHQVSTRIHYVGALPRSRLLAAAGAVVAEQPWLGGVGVALVAGVAMLLLRGGADDPRGRLSRAVARAALLAVSATVLGAFVGGLQLVRVARHVGWIAMYTTPAILALLCAGVALTPFSGRREAGARETSVALSFFAGPALCYVIDPMVVPLQPWAMRRFVPMVFPLFFLLALRGWQSGLRRVLARLPALAVAVLASLAIAIAGTFLRSTVCLLSRPAGESTAASLRALERAIPPGALILVPDASADLHLQIALEYAHGRDVLLLPLDDGAEADVHGARERFLARWIGEGRRVCLLLPRPTDLPGPLPRRFDVDFLAEVALSFENVSLAGPDTFPEPPGPASLRIRVVEVRLPQPLPEMRSVRVGEAREDVAILVSGFHAPEAEAPLGQVSSPFRWTGPLATMAVPAGSAVVLTIDTARPARAERARVEVDVDGVPAVASLAEPGWQRLRISLPRLEGTPRKRILSLRTNTFRMTDLGLSRDGRELGVRVSSARLEP